MGGLRLKTKNVLMVVWGAASMGGNGFEGLGE